MAETAALLADEVLPERPLRQWVLSLPHAFRFLLATNPAAPRQASGRAQRLSGGERRFESTFRRRTVVARDLDALALLLDLYGVQPSGA
jgi:hypothetical protein